MGFSMKKFSCSNRNATSCLDKSKWFVTFDMLFMVYVKAFKLDIFASISIFNTLAFIKVMMMATSTFLLLPHLQFY